MIAVDLYELGNGGWKKVGDVTFDNGRLVGTGDGVGLIKQPLDGGEDVGMCDPVTEPERFIKALPRAISGSYYRANTRENAGAQKRKAARKG
jgi:hypothetical protein